MWIAKTLSFAGTCTARSVLTLVSRRIMRPFRTRQVTARFPAGCLNLMSLRFYAADDNSAPTSGPPSGISLLQDYGPTDAIRGEAVQIVLDHVVASRDAGSYLKVYADNTDYYDHAVDVDITIEVEDQ
ncbi:MAG TPA: hypothetical protein DCQ64_12350 [Candidatus Rokubacteria bacterium]|nr:hypothetical protein [Candidatus Rokubacteria bacterium]